MKHSTLRTYKTGVLVPVFSLRTPDSTGVGEFLDLVPLAEWCQSCSLDLIQLLPVNDTGDDASPYNALSAFALHPVYCRVQVVPEYARLDPAVQKAVDKQLSSLKSNKNNFEYMKVRSTKISVLKTIFEAFEPAIKTNKELKSWLADNPWAKDYGVFMALKDQHQRAGWKFWREEVRRGSRNLIDRLWEQKEISGAALFWAWLQFRIEEQFLLAVKSLDEKGITLKGDIPIMMNEDSVDVWSQPENFFLDLRAGAPPDMFSRMGQNWGFPIYNWDYLEAHDYSWWRSRLKQADKFYHAFRIDHVLGFFRIWTIPHENTEGILGYFKPSIFLSLNELANLGFDKGRVHWLAEPHIPGQRLNDLFGMRSIEIIGRCFDRIGEEDLYLFKPEIQGERTIHDLPLMQDEKEHLLGMFRDRALIRVDDGLYSPSWTFRDCWRYHLLGEQEKQSFERLVGMRQGESEKLWASQGEKLLKFMRETVPMLACAEDLGTIPDCVPGILEKTGVLSLKIPRWARFYGQPGQPWIRPQNYPFLSVCATSVHDTSTLREWWETDGDHESFWYAIGGEGPCPHDYNPETARVVLGKIFETSSALCVVQLQEFFALHGPFRVDQASSERVNVPGTVGEHNWSWRLPFNIEKMAADKGFVKEVKALAEERKKRKPVF